jgi:hypothetical protein
LPIDRFTGFGTGLPVISIGKPIIPIILVILNFSNAKFEFGAVFESILGFQSLVGAQHGGDGGPGEADERTIALFKKQI